MQRLNHNKAILNNADGFAVVEAAFVFPIMFMVFFALVLLAFYLPQRAMLQRATQLAATAIATEMSDTWIYYDSSSQSFGRYGTHGALRSGKGGVYVTLFKSVFSKSSGGAKTIVEKLDEKENPPIIAIGELNVKCELINYVIYKEVVVTAERKIKVPINLSMIEFPESMDLVVTSKAVVQDGDEFMRNVDLSVDFVYWASEKLGLDINGIFSRVGQAGSKISNFFGI